MNDECLHCEHSKVPAHEEPCRSCLRAYFLTNKTPSFEPDPNITIEDARKRGEEIWELVTDGAGHLSDEGRERICRSVVSAIMSGIFSPAEFEKKMREVRGDEIEK